MSKRHFTAIAVLLRDEYARAGNNRTTAEQLVGKCAVYSLAIELSNLFAQENPRFDRERFLTACNCPYPSTVRYPNVQRPTGGRYPLKVIQSFDDALTYVARCGFTIPARYASPGWIPEAQHRLCQATDALLKASGNESWYTQTFVPFRVQFKPYFTDETPRERVPYLSTFHVINVHTGKQVTVHAREF